MDEKKSRSLVLTEVTAELEKELESEISRLFDENEHMTLAQIEREIQKIKVAMGQRLLKKVLDKEEDEKVKKKTARTVKDA